MSSPYKKLREANDQWVGYINIAKLTPNKAYLMLGITPTNHSSYGPGQQAVVQGKDGRKWRTQLPGKYLAQLSKEHLEQFKEDIRMGSSPYLIFREKMIDNSYRIDIVENTVTMTEKFNNDYDIDELQPDADTDSDVTRDEPDAGRNVSEQNQHSTEEDGANSLKIPSGFLKDSSEEKGFCSKRSDVKDPAKDVSCNKRGSLPDSDA